MGFVRRYSRMAVVFASIVLVVLGAGSRGARARGHDAERHLFVWAGDQARTAPDFLAVVDFDPGSPRYGQVITTGPLPGSGASGNEPHHVGLSQRRPHARARRAAQRAQGPERDLLLRRLAARRRRASSRAADPPQSAITDEFYALPGGGFLVTMMGGAAGHHPGRVVEFDGTCRSSPSIPRSRRTTGSTRTGSRSGPS